MTYHVMGAFASSWAALCFLLCGVRGEGGQPNCEAVIGCECLDLDPVTGVICENGTDFSLFAEKLRDGSLYPENETYEITLAGVRRIPARFLEGLIVFRLYLDDPATEGIDGGAFEGVLRLRRLHVRASSVSVLPNFTSVSNSLRNLNFDGSNLTSVQDELWHLPLLTELTLHQNHIRSVAADAFRGTTALTIVDFSENLLESLPPNLLNALRDLKKLVLSYNRLHTVHGLLRIARPKVIYFDHNNLTNADDILYENMTEVETLQLNNNPLRKVSSRSFNFKIPKARFLYLDFCEIEHFDVSHYQTLSNLSLLDLTGNHIEKIPNATIDFGTSLQLLLDNNMISSFEAEIKFSMKRLYLSGNQLRFLGKMLQLTQLAEIEVNDNHLEVLVDTDFRGVHATENLLLRNNSIRRLDTGTFTPIRNDLQNLDLSINLITSLNGSVRYQSRLKSLNVSSNQIATLREGEFVGMNELSELYMQNNRIVMLSGQIQRMPQLVYLILQNNKISTLSVDQIPKSLKFLYFKDNPIVCDCRLVPFLEWMSQPTSPKTDVSYCVAPPPGGAVQSSRFAPCPDPCSCYCTHDSNDSYVVVDCSSRNLTWIPRIFVRRADRKSDFFLDRKSMTVAQNRNPGIIASSKVLTVNLEGNNIESLAGWRFPFDLKELRLARNQLSELPSHVQRLRYLQRVTLSDNPWSCVCDALEFKKWLTSKSDNVLDVNLTRCGVNADNPATSGKLIVPLSEVDLCPVSVALYITVVFSVLSILLLVLVLTVLYHRYELTIKVWLYAHGVSWVKEEDLDKDKIFDAFLSFSHEDEEFVTKHIIEEIEDRMPNIRLCIHYRNFVPGDFIHNNIMNAVRFSKKTVLILTKNFFESDWCMWEFQAAHVQAMEDKVVRIIVIKVGDIPEDIDPAMKAYLKSTTYVTWGERYFWQKLLYCLPEPPKRFHNDGSTAKLVEAT